MISTGSVVYAGLTSVPNTNRLKRLMASFRGQPDGIWGWQWHQLDHMQTICTSLQRDNHTSTSSLNFYGPDALPDAQPTVSQH